MRSRHSLRHLDRRYNHVPGKPGCRWHGFCRLAQWWYGVAWRWERDQ